MLGKLLLDRAVELKKELVEQRSGFSGIEHKNKIMKNLRNTMAFCLQKAEGGDPIFCLNRSARTQRVGERERERKGREGKGGLCIIFFSEGFLKGEVEKRLWNGR